MKFKIWIDKNNGDKKNETHVTVEMENNNFRRLVLIEPYTVQTLISGLKSFADELNLQLLK